MQEEVGESAAAIDGGKFRGGGEREAAASRGEAANREEKGTKYRAPIIKPGLFVCEPPIATRVPRHAAHNYGIREGSRRRAKHPLLAPFAPHSRHLLAPSRDPRFDESHGDRQDTVPTLSSWA